MTIYIIYHQLYTLDSKQITVGGIQTYLFNLAKLLKENGLNPSIYQLGDHSWSLDHEGVNITAIKKSNGAFSNHSKNILNEVLKHYKNGDLIIWGSDSIAVRNKYINSLSIQHGIGFDYIAKNSKLLRMVQILKLSHLYKYLQRVKSINCFMKSKHKVCVDYNYVNWIRTMLPRERLKGIYVIPNFTYINDNVSNKSRGKGDIHILFARRFTEERGVFVLLKIIDQVLAKYPKVKFTLAGSGPYKELLLERYMLNESVTITSYSHTESLVEHTKHDIAIIPTYGSEGTSLSLLEAMTSGCVPIASNIGGMTNIVLDNYNGYLVEPNAESFVNKIGLLIDNPDTMLKLAKNAKLSVDSSFSYDIWAERWLKVIYDATQ